MGTLVDNGGCSFDGEIKNWLPFRQKLCRSSDGMGLGWVYEISNVLSAYLQKAVAEMSKKDREAGGIVTDFSKFSVAQLKNGNSSSLFWTCSGKVRRRRQWRTEALPSAIAGRRRC
jgi:hypothetical protein